MPRSVTLKSHPAKGCQALACALMLLSLSGISARAETDASSANGNAGTVDKQNTVDEVARSEALATKKAGGEQTRQKTEASTSRPSNKPFTPTEKISEDFSVPFPVDI